MLFLLLGAKQTSILVYLAPKKHDERNRHKDRQKYLIKIHPKYSFIWPYSFNWHLRVCSMYITESYMYGETFHIYHVQHCGRVVYSVQFVVLILDAKKKYFSRISLATLSNITIILFVSMMLTTSLLKRKLWNFLLSRLIGRLIGL